VVTGGDDGYTGVVDGDYIGNRVEGTGLYSFWNPEEVDINLLICPGVSSQNVQDFLIQVCETRGDCMTILDPPDWATIDSVQDILDFTNGTLSRTTSLNSSYAAIYWTWQQVYDEFHDENVWTAPSGHLAGVYTYNDNVSAEWFAPAGLKRGKVSGSRDVRYSPDQDDRDALYGPGAVVNPIVNFVGDGITVFGQKTTQRATTALNRVNVRRALLYLKKIIATSSRYLVFDPNDDILFREFKQLVEPVFDDIVARRGLVEYLIVNATTDSDRANNKAVFKMFVKPQTTAEIIELQFVLTPQGADFQELLAA
jgi:phage tail sheath protein FI